MLCTKDRAVSEVPANQNFLNFDYLHFTNFLAGWYFVSCIHNYIKQIQRLCLHVTSSRGRYADITVPCIVILSAECTGVLSVTLLARYLPLPPVSVECESLCVAGLVWKICRNGRYFLPPAGYQTWLPGCPAGIAFAIPTELSGITYIYEYLAGLNVLITLICCTEGNYFMLIAWLRYYP